MYPSWKLACNLCLHALDTVLPVPLVCPCNRGTRDLITTQEQSCDWNICHFQCYNVTAKVCDLQGHASAGLHALASYLPSTVSVTSISISRPTPLHVSPASDQKSKGHLIITRHQGTEPPLLMTIPVPLGDFGNAPDSKTEHSLCSVPNSQVMILKTFT